MLENQLRMGNWYCKVMRSIQEGMWKRHEWEAGAGGRGGVMKV